MEIIQAGKEEILIAATLMKELWPENTIDHLIEEITRHLEQQTEVIFLLKQSHQYIGFLCGSLRTDYVEGCEYSPVGYIEGIYTIKEERNKGYAKLLVDYFAVYAKEHGCMEMASDCELANTGSYAFHLSLGFEEQNRIICFKKNLFEK